MRGKPSVARALGSVALVVLVWWQTSLLPVYPHLDPPGPPPINTRVEVLNVLLITDEDDGFDLNAEVLLHVEFRHSNHGAWMATSFENQAFDFDTSPIWRIPANISTIWNHDECSPREPIVILTILTEIDNGSMDIVKTGLIGAGRIGLAALIGGPVTIALAGATAVIAVIVVSVNGHDSLGFNIQNVPENGVLAVPHVGSGGSANVDIQGRTVPITDIGQCGAPQPPDPTPTPDEVGSAIYTPFRDALDQLEFVSVEPGNPGGLTDAQMDDIRETFESWIVNAGKLAAGVAIEDARTFDGVGAAITHFQMGQSLHGAGDATGAIDYFEMAFKQATTAYGNGIPGSDTSLPFQIATTPSFMSTVEGRDFSVLAAGLGGGGPVNMAVFGAPPEMTTNVSQIDPSVPIFEIELRTTGVPPGTYPLQIVGDDGFGTALSTLTVVVNPRDTGLDIQEPGYAEFAFTPGVGAKGLEPSPGGIWGDYVYVSDSSAGLIERIDAQENVSLFATGRNFPVGMTFVPGTSAAFGDFMYVSEYSGSEIVRFDELGNASTFASVSLPGDVTFDPTGAYGTDMFATTAFTGPISTVDSTGASTFFSDVGATYLEFGPGGGWGTGLYSTKLAGSNIFTLTQIANATIPDSATDGVPGTPLTLPLVFPESKIIADLDVGAKITHANISDLSVTVEHPDGTSVVLFDRNCSDAQYADIDTFFDDEGTAQSCNPSGPTPDPNDGNGNLMPQAGTLTTFDGKNAQGQWLLHLTDSSPGHVGTLDEWSLRVTESNTGIAKVHADGTHDLLTGGFLNPEGFDWAFGPGWNGDMFATDNVAGKIHRIQPDGTKSLWATLPGAADVAFWNCSLYVVSADGGCWRVTSDADDLDQDGRGDPCDNCPIAANPDQNPAIFGQQIAASDRDTFFWSTATDVTYVRGDLASISTFAVDMVQSLFGATSFTDTEVPEAGFWYMSKPLCAGSSWQTEFGSEPWRDAALP